MGRRRRGEYLHPHEVLLETDLAVSVTGSGGADTQVTLTLTRDKLLLTRRDAGCCGAAAVTEILGRDIVSVRPPRLGDSGQLGKRRPALPVFLIVAFPRTASSRREKRSYFFQVGGRLAARREDVAQLGQVWVEAVTQICLGRLAPGRGLVTSALPLLVLINPTSGRGEATRVWQRASQVLSEAGRAAEVVVTEAPGHASHIMAQLELAAWAGVVVVAGDGLLHEVYNGLLARPDWRAAIQFSVGALPGGSGNALVSTLASAQGDLAEEDGGLMSAAVSVARGNLAAMDLFLVRGPGPDLRVGFLSLGWGLLTDVDIDSEALRRLGQLRFTVFALLKIARRRLYRGTISYVPADWPERGAGPDSEDSDWTGSSLDPGRALLPGCLAAPPRHLATYADSWQELDQRLCSVSFVTGGGAHAQCGHAYSYTNPGQVESREASVQRQSSAPHQRRSSSHSTRDSSSRSRSSASPEKSSSRGRSASSPDKPRARSHGATKRKLAPPVDTPLSATPTCIPPTAPPPVFPSSSPPRGPAPAPACDPAHAPLTATPLHKDWVSETADFVAVMAFNLPHLTRAVRGAPDCSPDDGVLWLLVIRANVSRVSLLQLLAGMDSGRRLSVPGVDMFPVTAIKISPDPAHLSSFMALDGEFLPAGDIQLQVLPSAARVMVK